MERDERILMRLGIDYGGTNLKTGIFTDEGDTVLFKQEKLSVFTSEGNLLENILCYVKEVSENYPVSSGGLAIKGLINTETGVMEEDIGAGSLLAGIRLADQFSNRLSIPFKVENDARAYAWGEYKFGAGRGTKTMVCFTLGTGAGCSVVTDGKPFYGSDVLGGLLGGHISIDRNGLECPCGNKGCLELYCSATAFTNRVLDKHPELSGSENVLKDFFERIKSDQTKYLDTLFAFQEDLSIGIVNAIHAYGPDVVVIGGGVMNSAQLILPRVAELVHKRAWTFPRGKVQIKPSELGSIAAALGVAFL